MIRSFSLWGNYLCAIIRACLGLTCAQQHFAFAQVLDGLGHFAQTLLGQVRRVSEDDVEAVRRHAVRKRQRLVVVVEHEVLSVGGEAAVVLQHHGRHPIWTVHHALLQLLVHAGRAQACYPGRKGGPEHKGELKCWCFLHKLTNLQNQTSILHVHRTQVYFHPVSLTVWRDLKPSCTWTCFQQITKQNKKTVVMVSEQRVCEVLPSSLSSCSYRFFS